MVQDDGRDGLLADVHDRVAPDDLVRRGPGQGEQDRFGQLGPLRHLDVQRASGIGVGQRGEAVRRERQ